MKGKCVHLNKLSSQREKWLKLTYYSNVQEFFLSLVNRLYIDVVNLSS